MPVSRPPSSTPSYALAPPYLRYHSIGGSDDDDGILLVAMGPAFPLDGNGRYLDRQSALSQGFPSTHGPHRNRSLLALSNAYHDLTPVQKAGVVSNNPRDLAILSRAISNTYGFATDIPPERLPPSNINLLTTRESGPRARPGEQGSFRSADPDSSRFPTATIRFKEPSESESVLTRGESLKRIIDTVEITMDGTVRDGTVRGRTEEEQRNGRLFALSNSFVQTCAEDYSHVLDHLRERLHTLENRDPTTDSRYAEDLEQAQRSLKDLGVGTLDRMVSHIATEGDLDPERVEGSDPLWSSQPQSVTGTGVDGIGVVFKADYGRITSPITEQDSSERGGLMESQQL